MNSKKNAAPPPALVAAAQSLQSDPAKAEAQVREFLETQPGHGEAGLVLAVALRLQGKAGEALGVLAALAEADPASAMLEYEIGLALSQQGKWGPALASLRRSAELEPELPGVWRAIGDALYELKEFFEADQAYERFVTKAANDPLLAEAVMALENGRADIAESHARMRLKHQPTDIVAMRLLADICANTNRVDEAERLLRDCTARAPGFVPAQMEFMGVLMRQSKFSAALDILDRLLDVNPSDGNLLTRKAHILGSMGDFDGAVAHARRVAQMFPEEPAALLGLAQMLRIAGGRDEAIGLFNRVIALDPANGEAYWSLANLRNYPFTEFEAEAMRVALESKDLSDSARVQLRFALGQALDNIGQYEDAFHSFQTANALQRMKVTFDPDGPAGVVTRSRQLLSRDFFPVRTPESTQSTTPIFIIGMPRSGSTLVEQILASHSQVEGLGELPQLIAIAGEIVGPRGDAAYPHALTELDASALSRFGERYLERIAEYRRESTPFIVDKTPNNFFHTGLIELILPHAKIIDVRRHPLACGFSNFIQLFGRGHEFTYRLSEIGRYYRDYVQLMAHYDRVLPGRVHRVMYENLITAPEVEIRALLDYCGLPFEEACLKPHENKRAVLTPSSEQVRQPINTGTAEHWRHYEPFLAQLKAALGPVLDAYPDVPADF